MKIAGNEVEPLTEFEQMVKENLHNHMPKVKIEELTEEQKFSAARMITRLMPVQDAFMDYLCGYLGIRFRTIVSAHKQGDIVTVADSPEQVKAYAERWEIRIIQ